VNGVARARFGPPIDNNPTPSYVSANLGWCSFAGAFASFLPEKCRISGAPEAKSGRRGVLKESGSQELRR